MTNHRFSVLCCWAIHSIYGCGTTDLPVTFMCGDWACNGTETCASCARDCGACNVAHCGDAACNGDEYCGTCSQDCGLCEPGACGDGTCSGGESCQSCPTDCGACASCGDGSCSGGESCGSCPTDCGACASCGDGSCSGGESCGSCPSDCGQCTASCGDGTCAGSESCNNCPDDCGQCTSVCGDGACGGSETCTTCSSDCGVCSWCHDFTASGAAQTTILYDPYVVGSVFGQRSWESEEEYVSAFYFFGGDLLLQPGQRMAVNLDENGNNAIATCQVCVFAGYWDSTRGDYRTFFGTSGRVTFHSGAFVDTDFRIELDDIYYQEVDDNNALMPGGECGGSNETMAAVSEPWPCYYFAHTEDGQISASDSVCVGAYDNSESDLTSQQLASCYCPTDDECYVVIDEWCATDSACTDDGNYRASYCE